MLGNLLNIFSKIAFICLTIISLPIFIIVSVSILFTSGFPIFFVQDRVGKGGKVFRLFKFRTMVRDAEKIQGKYQKLNEADGPAFKIRNDPRFTRLGRFLSHTGLDELPQLYNIIIGDMVLIGPRPLPINEAHKLKPWMQERHKIKPGIISPWILEGYHRNSFTDWMQSDLRYVEQKSPIYDIKLAGKAFILMFRLFCGEIGIRG
jgi:lipopolysaccharide/colanic/teichoic acid biosynthesis glycosyltransferase